MISLIVCSIDQKSFSDFSKNVSKTIGVPFEVIRIDNSRNFDSICSAYNKGSKMAVLEILCFVHEDVVFQTENWGRRVCDLFEENPNLGLLGIAGGGYKTFAPASWGLIPEARFVNIIQQHKYKELESFHDVQNPSRTALAEVVCIDGVWMCTTRVIAMEIGFDESTLKGFHGYDIDFSLSVYKKYCVAVTFEILLTHFSEGKNDKSWVVEMLKLHRKWQKELPVSSMPAKSLNTEIYEGYAVNDFLTLMICLGFPARDIFSMLSYNNHNPNLNKNFLISLKLRAFRYWFLNTWAGRILPGKRSAELK